MTFAGNLERLSNACGVPGREAEIRALMNDLLGPHVDEIHEDKLGNIVAVKKGERKPQKVMLAAHMDEIGLLVKSITNEGFLHFAKLGGIDDRVLMAQKVMVYTEKGPLHGIIGSKPPHIQKEEERKKVVMYDQLFIDVGANSKDEASKRGVKVGDSVGFDAKFARVSNDVVIGKAFDDRVGCAVMIESLKALKRLDCAVYAVGTVQEEVGLRGAGTAAFGIDPDIGIALDVTVAGDTPGVKEVEAPIKMRQGPSLTVADSGLIAHPKTLRLMIDAAEENKIPYQLEAGLPGSTDAARISLTRQGVPSGTICVPARYIHSPISLISLKDAEDAVKLTLATLQRISTSF